MIFSMENLELKEHYNYIINNNIKSSREASSKTQLLESRWASLMHANYALGMSSALAALHVALLSCGIKAGDEVLVDSLFKYGALATLQCNAIPVFFDVTLNSYMPKVIDIRKKITVNTKAIIITNVFGCTPDLLGIRKLCDEMGIFLIEDCAQTPFCKCNDRYAGGYGDFGIFSFHSTTHFSLGDGGMLITNNKDLYKKSLIIHDENIEDYNNECNNTIRCSYRMSELVSEIALFKLKYIDQIMLYHIEVGERLRDALSSMKLQPQENVYSQHVYWKVGTVIADEDLYCYLEERLNNIDFLGWGLNGKQVVPELQMFKNYRRTNIFSCPYDCIFASEDSKRSPQIVNAPKVARCLMTIRIVYGTPIEVYKDIIEKLKKI